jgi:hypothetical protein
VVERQEMIIVPQEELIRKGGRLAGDLKKGKIILAEKTGF